MSQVRLSVGSMTCRHCVREVTARLRDVAGVETVAADSTTGTVVLAGTMSVDQVLAAFEGSGYTAQVVDDTTPSTAW